jgi:hypothetical protein
MSATDLEARIRAQVIASMIEDRKYRLSDRQARIAAIQTEITLDEAVIADLERELAALPTRQADANGSPTPAPASDETEPRSLPEMIVRVFQETNRPMRGWEIVKRLKELGVRSDSKKGLLPAVFTTFKRRQDLFEKVEKGLYRLAEGNSQEGG